MLTTFYKKRILFLHLLNNCISARSVPQILSLKDEYTFNILNFIIIGLCHSPANSWFGISSLLMTLSANLFARVAE